MEYYWYVFLSILICSFWCVFFFCEWSTLTFPLVAQHRAREETPPTPAIDFQTWPPVPSYNLISVVSHTSAKDLQVQSLYINSNLIRLIFLGNVLKIQCENYKSEKKVEKMKPGERKRKKTDDRKVTPGQEEGRRRQEETIRGQEGEEDAQTSSSFLLPPSSCPFVGHLKNGDSDKRCQRCHEFTTWHASIRGW